MKWKSELRQFAIDAKSRKGTLTANGRDIELHTLLAMIKSGAITGCNYYLSRYDFHARSESIFDESDSRFQTAMCLAMCLDD